MTLTTDILKFFIQRHLYSSSSQIFKKSVLYLLLTEATIYPASEMTYIVSSGALNSTHSLVFYVVAVRPIDRIKRKCYISLSK